MASTVNDIHLIGLAAARPAASASNRGYLYTATDTSGGTTYRSDGSTWTQIAGPVTGGSGAPTTAEYIVGALDGTLSAERLLTNNTKISWDLSTAGQAKATITARGVGASEFMAVTDQRLLGRFGGGSGDVQEITIGSGLSLSGGGALSVTSSSPYYLAAAYLATTGNISLSGAATIDGVAVTTFDRILVKDQTTAADNGLYLANTAGAWIRDTDFDAVSGEAVSGAIVSVQDGTTNADTIWQLTTNPPITLGGTSLTFSRITAIPAGSAGGDLTGTYPSPTVAARAITYAKFQAIATSRILGRTTAGSGDVEELTVGSGLSLSGGVLNTAGAPPTGTAGGDLSGTYPNPTVAKANGNTFPASVATGDLIYGSGASALSKLGIGSTGQVLKVSSGLPAWGAVTVGPGASWDGGGSAIPAGSKSVLITIPYAGTITKWRLQGDVSGSAVVDVWKTTFATGSIPTVANTITASAKPTITATFNAESSTLTGWTTSVAAGDVLRFNVDSCSSITMLTIVLYIDKS